MPSIKGTDFANSCTWKILEEDTHSDHNYILMEAPFSQSHYSYPRFKSAYGGHRRMLKHLSRKTKQLVQRIEESNTKDHLAKATEELPFFAACRKAYKIKKFKLKLNNNWWNQNLQIKKKKEFQALKRKTNKSQEDNKRKYQPILSEKQADLKSAAKNAKRHSFRNTCTKTTVPYGRPYKAVVKNKHPPVELLKQSKQWRYQIIRP
ncbi:hypothetical protein AVEN_213310-1 [Araneus ventricosus]|uniref:Endonuclease/exonuclease/phosphatase domain-containing protein n=1 Tax=Araneus ventricosus TaxID=182803 RepID=A0A4Y2AJF5_ARAVE|nr:hypothetical protein AVEN_60728-1 [Araneus ventricosus]GBL79467.1 hypothetical protein AVEN_213310-1 [Araneus ventricosus]